MTVFFIKNWKKISLALLLVFSVFFIPAYIFAQEVPERPSGVPDNAEYDESSGLWCATETVVRGSGANRVALQERNCYDSSGGGSTVERSADGGSNFVTKSNLDSSGGSGGDGSCGLFDFWLSPVNCTVYALAYTVGVVASFIFFLGGLLITLALDLNSQVLSLEVVRQGWTFTRDLANLGFVLAILVISFGIIVRIEQYGSMKILRNLIISALLVNFSLVIAGVILDVAGILTTFFANMGLAQGEGFWEFTEKLANTTQIYDLNTINSTLDGSVIGGVEANSVSAIVQLLSVIFLVLFTILAAIIFLGIAVMFLIRFIALSLLLIVMPLAFLANIFPKTQGHYSKWWDDFLKWTFFAPTSMFFLALATTSLLSTTNSQSLGMLGDGFNPEVLSKANEAFGSSLILQVGVDSIMTMLVVLGFLGMSITFGFAGSITQANFARNWVSGVKDWTINKARRGAIRGAKATGRTAFSATNAATRGNLQKGFDNLAESSKNIPLINKLTAGAAVGVSAASSTGRRSELEIRKKQYSKVSKDDIARQYRLADGQGKAALIEIAAEKGWVSKLPDIDYNKFETFDGDKGKLAEKDILLSEDKKDEKNVLKTLRDKNKTEEDFAKVISEKIKSMKPDDFGKVQWSDVLDGKNIRNIKGVSISEEDWKAKYQPKILEAIGKNTKGKEFGNIIKKSSVGERTELANKTMASLLNISNDDLKKLLTQRRSDADYQDTLMDIEPEDIEKDPQKALKSVNLLDLLSKEQKEQLQKENESVYKYVKNNLHSAGADSSDDKKEDKKEESEEKGEDKK